MDCLEELSKEFEIMRQADGKRRVCYLRFHWTIWYNWTPS